MPLTLTLTTAGRAALVNAQNTGLNALSIAEIGVSDQDIAGDLTALAALPAELKRLTTFAGDVTADDTLHVTIRDESADSYAMRAFGLYFHTGVLFGVYRQPDPIVEKSAAAMALLAVDIVLADLMTEQIEFGDTDFINPAATLAAPGVVELATAAETATGTDQTRAVTPRGLKQLLDAIVAGLAPLFHVHDAGHTTTGVFNVGRIPALDMSKITGLATALAGKAANTIQIVAGAGLTGGGALTGHRTLALGAPATVSGDSQNRVTAEGHEHALSIGVADVAGLQTALDVRALQGGAVMDWDDVSGSGIYWGAAAAAAQPTAAAGVIQVERTPSRRAQLALSTNGETRMFLRGIAAGGWRPWAEAWTTENFDPASKADAIHGHDWAQVTGKPELYAYLGSLGATHLDTVMVNGVFRQGANANAVIALGYPADTTGGFLFVATSGSTTHQTYFTRNGDRQWSRTTINSGASWTTWTEVWTEATFDPASKADVASPALTGNPTAPTRAAGDNSTRLATTAYADRAAALAAAAAMPAGVVAHFAAPAPPAGWLECDGSAISRTTYAALFAALGTRHGVGNGSSTFNLPDLRGEFVRGWDSGRGIDAGRTFGSWQADEFRSHSHGLTSHFGGFMDMETLTDTNGADERWSASNRTMAEGGVETRPRNVALLACIKF